MIKILSKVYPSGERIRMRSEKKNHRSFHLFSLAFDCELEYSTDFLPPEYFVFTTRRHCLWIPSYSSIIEGYDLSLHTFMIPSIQIPTFSVHKNSTFHSFPPFGHQPTYHQLVINEIFYQGSNNYDWELV